MCEATREVEVLRLDDVLARTDPMLIKMDVEGHESEVVAGAIRTFAKTSLAAVITETADATVRSVMETNGFVCAAYQPFERLVTATRALGSASSSQNTLFVRMDNVVQRVATAARRDVAGVMV